MPFFYWFAQGGIFQLYFSKCNPHSSLHHINGHPNLSLSLCHPVQHTSGIQTPNSWYGIQCLSSGFIFISSSIFPYSSLCPQPWPIYKLYLLTIPCASFIFSAPCPYSCICPYLPEFSFLLLLLKYLPINILSFHDYLSFLLGLSAF